MQIQHDVTIKCRGRFHAIRHTGHKFDEFGNVIEFGKILEKTHPSNNTITLNGFNKMLGRVPTLYGSGSMGPLIFVAGSGNTAPAESQSTLVSYQGKTNVPVAVTTTRNVTPDVDGNVMWRVTYRVTFNPGSLGSGFKNITEAGVVMEGVDISAVNGATLIGARGLLVDGSGNPTSVSLDADGEYLDLIWEYTEWVPASITGTVNLSIDGSTVVHDYEVRPCWFDNTGGSFNNRGWQNVSSLTGPSFTPVYATVYDATNANTVVLEGPLGALYGENPGGTYDTANRPPAMNVQLYTSNSKYRDVECVWTPLYGNIDIGVLRINMSHMQFQVSYDPVIEKVNTKQLRLMIRFSMANAG